MDILNLTIEFHQSDGHLVKRVVRIEQTTKVGEVVRLLLDKFGKSSSDQDASQFQLSLTQKSTHSQITILTDSNKTLQAYGIKNNDELLFKKRPKKNPASAKLSKKKPDGIFKTLFSMSTLEMKLQEEKQFVNITDVDNRIDIPNVLYITLDYLDNYFSQVKDIGEISSSFQYYGAESEYSELLRAFNQLEPIDMNNYKSPKLLCNFLLFLLQSSLSETSLTYSLYTTFLKSATLDSKSSIFYDIPPKNRVILKQMMLFFSKLTIRDISLLDTVSSIISPFILGRIESPHSSRTPTTGSYLNIPSTTSTGDLSSVSSATTNTAATSPTTATSPPITSVTSPNQPFIPNNRVLSNEETALCKKVAIDLIQNISTYLLYSPYKFINQNEGEKTIFSSENIFCLDKCNFPPSVANLGEIWVTNYRIIYVNSQPGGSSHNPPSCSSSSSIGSNNTNSNIIGNSSSSIPGSQSNNNLSSPQSINSSTSVSFVLNQKLSTYDNCEIPLFMIQNWKQIKAGSLFESYKLYLKDFRCKVIGFPVNSPHLAKFKEILEYIRSPSPATMFAFQNTDKSITQTENFSEHKLLQEYNRQGVSWDDWRTTNTNSLLKVCDYYPMSSVVPKSVSDNIVVTSAYYRAYRFPVLSWSHPTNKASITRAAAPEGYATTTGPLSPRGGPTGGAGGSTSIVSAMGMGGMVSGGFSTTAPTSSSTGGQSLSPRLPSSMSTSQMPQVCQEDIDLLKAIVDIKSAGMLSVYDTGPSASYALSMIGCKIEFLALPTPDKISQAYYKLLHLHRKHPDRKWTDGIRFNWLNLLKPILAASIAIADSVEKGQPIMIQNRDESDADAQLSSIAQLLLDQHYRTIEGFRTLIEKEWLCYGHPFAKRSGHELLSRSHSISSPTLPSSLLPNNNINNNSSSAGGMPLSIGGLGTVIGGNPNQNNTNSGNTNNNNSGNVIGGQNAANSSSSSSNNLMQQSLSAFDPDNDFSPIFMQFLFIVWQIWKEFPTAFQFNEEYLIELIDNVYACKFGTFLCNNIKEREDMVFNNTKSYWSWVSKNQNRFYNPLFVAPSGKRSFLKCNRVFQDTMWNEYFYRYCFKSMLSLENLDEKINRQLVGDINNPIVDLSNLRLFMVSEHAMRQLTNVRDLNLSKNNLNSLSISMLHLSNLERLDLEENQLINLSPEFISILARNLPNLTELDFSSNQFEDLPSTLTSFKKLQILAIRNNKFAIVPEVIDQMTTLTSLDMAYCQVAPKIPMGSRNTLRLLDLSHIDMTELPNEISELQQLEQLFMDHNLLNTLPASFSKLVKLQELSIDGNQLKVFPPEILHLTDLRRLSLECNMITQLPSDINHLTQLRELNLRQNKLELLPASIGQLSNLVHLNLSHNLLTTLRPTMGLLSALNELRLEGNQLRTPPPEIVSQGLVAILDYLKDLIKGQEQCYRMKLMIVGQENVGKTTLIKALRDKKRKAGGPNISTDGIVIDNWVFTGQFDDIDSETGKPIKKRQDVTLSVWDFAGQEIYYTTHQFFLSERSVYIVCWNILLEEEVSRVEFWLQSIVTRTKDAPIIIVGTHLDDSNKTHAKSIKKKMKEKYLPRFPNILAIKMVSCTTGKGVSQLRDTLEALVVKQPNMGESLPRSYMLLENLVKEETKKRDIPTIPWQEFVQLGTICTITDEAELLRATMFLNQLGSLVYFPKELGLKQFVILDPQWITVVLSSIITTKHSYAKDGILPHKSLKQIWRPPQYPENLHPHLITLLEKFEISYNLGSKQQLGKDNFIMTIDENAQSLIPSLLPNERPAQFSNLWQIYNPKEHREQYGRNYKFEFIPNGFFSRLMVRILNFAKGEAKCYWRNGMLLQREEEQIFIEMLNSRKLLCFTVRGKQCAQLSRDVSETIQSLLDDSFQLSTQIYIPCIHCIQMNNNHPYKFSLEVCENAAVKGVPYLKCQNMYPVRTDLLVPDLVMSNFTGSKIAYSQLHIDEMIGEGGAALVFRGKWKGHTVAIKKLKTINSQPPPPGVTLEINDISLSKAFNEFRRECWVMSGLEHPNIVQLKGLCLDPLCIVTEYLPHGNLYKFIHQEGFEMSWILRLKIALDISSGMAFLHSSTPPIIHRDLKSPNILLASVDEGAPVIAKVVDFGLSGLQHTITNRGVENPVWLAPEIIEKQEATTQSDIYAFGVILWEILTFKDFFGDLGFMSLLEDKVISGERPEIPESTPQSYRALIQDCWQNDPSKRPSFAKIEERIMEMVTEMFPNLQLLEPIAGSRKSIRGHKKSLSSGSDLASDTLVGEDDSQTTVDIASSNISNLSSLTNNTTVSTSTNVTSPVGINSSSSSILTTTTTNTTATTLNGKPPIDSSSQFKVNLDHSTLSTNIASSIGSLTQSIDLNALSDSNNHLITQSQEHRFFNTPRKISVTESNNSINNNNSNNNNNNNKSGENPTPVTSERKNTFYHNPKRNSVAVQPLFFVLSKDLGGEEGSIQCMILVKDQLWVGTGVGTITIWKRDGLEKVATIKANTKRIHCLYAHMDTVWCCGADNNITIWSTETLQLVKKFNGHEPTCFASVGHTMWVGSSKHAIHIFDIKKKVKYKTKISLEAGQVECMLKRDNEVWVAINNNIARIDCASQRVTQMIKAAHQQVIHCIIEVDSNIWTSSSDGAIKIWGSQTGQHIATIQAHPSRVFTLAQVGDFVWSGSWDTSIKIWSIRDYQQINETRGKHKDAVSCFIYVNGGGKSKSYVLSGSWDKTVCQWDVGFPNSLNSSSDMYGQQYIQHLLTSSSNSSNGSSANNSPFNSVTNLGSSPSPSFNSASSLANNTSPNNSSSNIATTTTTTNSSGSPISNNSPQIDPLISQSLPQNYSSSPGSGGTLSRHAKRTVSFVLDHIVGSKNK